MPCTRPMSLVSPAAPSPTELRALTRRAAGALRSGTYALPRPGSASRFDMAGADVRVVTWAPGARSGLHDRGGAPTAAGAFTVARGTLTEYVPAGWSDGWMWLRPE